MQVNQLGHTSNHRANQYLTSISIGKQYFPFYLAIIVLNAVKYTSS